MALTTASVVVAAKPADRATEAATVRAERIVSIVKSALGTDLQVPEELESQRLKIRMAPQFRARLLPNGDLLSLTGRDLSEFSDLLDGMGATLRPVLTTPEAVIERLTGPATGRGTAPRADLAATFWVDTEADLNRIARTLDRLSEVEMVTFSRTSARPAPRPVNRPAARPAPTPPAKQDATVPAWEPDALSREELIEYVQSRQTLVDLGPSKAEKLIRSLQARQSLAEQRLGQPSFHINPTGPSRGIGATSACCIFTFDPGTEMWDRTCLESADEDFQDTCEGMAVDDLVVTVFSDGLACNDVCTGGTFEGYGACCDAVGVRGGEDMLASECEEPAFWNGGDITVDTSFLAFNNCSSCELVVGSCCFGEDAIDVDIDFFIIYEEKFAMCDLVNPAPPISNSAWTYFPPNVEALPLAVYTEQFDTGGWFFFQNWMGFDVTNLADIGLLSPTNLPVISSARLIGNSDSETACERCTGFGGLYMGNTDPADPSTYPVTFYQGDLMCGDPTLFYVSECDPINGAIGDGGATILGSCAEDGELVVMSLESCIDAADAQAVGVHTIWQAAMLDPAYIETNPALPDFGLHRVHQNQWRPNWALYFTPPATENPDPIPFSPYNEEIFTWCPPKNPYIDNAPPNVGSLCVDPASNGLEIPPDYLVPFWEYAGTYVEWTGWDPARWWDEGVTMRQGTVDDFLVLLPPLSNGIGDGSGIASQLFPAIDTAGFAWPRSEGGRYDISIRFGLPPTCMELVGEYGLAQRPGDPLDWGPWEVTPVTNRWVFEYQLHGNPNDPVTGETTYEDLPGAIVLYPFDYGRNRWTDDVKFFDIGQETPYPVAHGRGRYLNVDQPAVTRWVPQGPQTGQPVSGDDIYGFRYNPEESGEAIRGSCYFPHTDAFPTILNTTNDVLFPGEQECYVGNYCDEVLCCDAVGAIIARCCSDSFEPWDALCVQVATDFYLTDRGTDGRFLWQYTCKGPPPFQIPQYPDVDMFMPTYVTTPMVPNPNPIPEAILGPTQYDPDPRNIAINPFTEVVLPTYIDPTYDTGTCQVTTTTAANSFQPTNGRGQAAAGLPAVEVPPTDSEFGAYASTRDLTGRLFQFIPRCQGIYSSAGQCNVPGSKSGRSSWDTVAEDESILIGCQDFDCCVRVIATLLQEKDVQDPNDEYSDFEWINFGHLGVPVDVDHPPLSGQWTPYMAMKARELCYPGVEKVNLDPDAGGDPDDAPNFSSLQINAVAEAHQLQYDGAATAEWIAGPATDPVTGQIVSGLADISDGQSDLHQLIWAPMSWSDPTLDDGSTCLPAHQNIYEMCPEPYYGGQGMAMWPDIDFASPDPVTPGLNAFASFSSGISYLDGVNPDADLNAYGEGIKIAVLAEAAWLQEYTLFGVTRGAVHQDLLNVSIDSTLPDNFRFDFGNERATARGTAVLGVIAATDNGFGTTGLAHAADTRFFPTRGAPVGAFPAQRLEDAFLAALDYLSPGDVMMLAYEPNTGTILNDPGSQGFLELAAARGISVIIPAGDQQADVGVPDLLGVENLTIVGAATPGGGSNYLRWWSSNYFGDENTVTDYVPGVPNICAWGGGVVTTGGNANLTLLTVENASLYGYGPGGAADPLYGADPVTGEYALTTIGKRYSFTNDFGANLDGSVAAASQVAAVTANLQGFCKSWFGFALLPDKAQSVMWDTALVGISNAAPAGIQGDPPTNAVGNPGGTYTWDLDEVNADEARSIGRMPQLGRLLNFITSNPPDDDDFNDDAGDDIECSGSPGLVDVTLAVGSLAQDSDPLDPSTLEMVDEYSLILTSDVATPPNGGAARDLTEIHLTFRYKRDDIPDNDSGIQAERAGLSFNGEYNAGIFDFESGRWRDFQGQILPQDDGQYTAAPFPGAPSNFARYGNILDDENCPDDPWYYFYVRIVTSSNTDVGQFQWTLNQAAIAPLADSGGP